MQCCREEGPVSRATKVDAMNWQVRWLRSWQQRSLQPRCALRNENYVLDFPVARCCEMLRPHHSKTNCEVLDAEGLRQSLQESWATTAGFGWRSPGHHPIRWGQSERSLTLRQHRCITLDTYLYRKTGTKSLFHCYLIHCWRASVQQNRRKDDVNEKVYCRYISYVSQSYSKRKMNTSKPVFPLESCEFQNLQNVETIHVAAT